MAYPKIVYNAGAGPVTFNFKWPPKTVPGFFYAATRHDNVASSGAKEFVLERIDNFLTLAMPYVALGSDLTGWSAFMLFALTGGQFAYYPDASLTTFTNYWLEDASWEAAYKAPGLYTFKLKFRQVVT